MLKDQAVDFVVSELGCVPGRVMQLDAFPGNAVCEVDADGRSLTQAEWDELGQKGMGGIPKSKLPMIFGMIMKDGDPEVIREMLSHAPLVPRLLLPFAGPRAYTRYARRLYGAAV